MHPKWKKFIFVFALVAAVPTTALTADWLLGWRAWLWQTPASQQDAQEVRKLYQLREFCNQSFAMEKRLDFAILKMEETRDGLNRKTVSWGLSTANSKQTNPLIESKARKIQSLRDRNFRYFENIFNGVAQDGAKDPSIWGPVQAKHDELAQLINSGEFKGCIDELDNLLPTRVTKGGRQ